MRAPLVRRTGWRRAGLGVLAGMLLPATLRAEPAAVTEPAILPLPVLAAGYLRGVFTPVAERPLAWTLRMTPAADGRLAGELSATGADFALRIELTFDPGTQTVGWNIREGRIDLAGWVPALATRPGLAVLAGVSATGIAEIAGAGTWRDGAATGELRVELTGARLSNDAQGWSLDGVSVRAGGGAAALLKGEVPVELEVRTITTSRFGARNLAAKARLADFERIEVLSTRVEIAGGEVTAEPFALSLASPALSVTLAMRRVGLQDLVVFVPTTLSEARGRINGRLRLEWTPEDGVRVGNGGLSLEAGEPTTLRLVSTPGFLTKSVPARFTLLPALPGVLSRWFSLANPGYDSLSDIERGKLGLRVDSLEVRLTPEGDERGRSASVVIRGRPEQEGSAVGAVTFEINVSGPLAAVLQMGMKQSFSVRAR